MTCWAEVLGDELLWGGEVERIGGLRFWGEMLWW